jgi:hypothetical protein
MLPSKRRSHIMLVNIDAEMSEILSVYPHFQESIRNRGALGSLGRQRQVG